METAADPSVWVKLLEAVERIFGPGGTVLVFVSAGGAWAIIQLFKSCRAEMTAAWARVTAISEARSADAKEMAKAVSDNTIALARVAERVDIADRRNGR